jgi:hypothetical protein
VEVVEKVEAVEVVEVVEAVEAVEKVEKSEESPENSPENSPRLTNGYEYEDPKFNKDIELYLKATAVARTYEFTKEDKNLLQCFIKQESDFSENFVEGILSPHFDEIGTKLKFAYDD